MKIYVICPVRLATGETTQFVENYVKKMEAEGHEVFWPQRDVDQENDPTGITIVNQEVEAIQKADEVHIFWDKESKGSHFDLGVALGLGIRVKLIHSFKPDPVGKTYEKVIKIKESWSAVK